MHYQELLVRLAHGHFHNVPFSDLVQLLEACGFRLLRTRGSHHIFGHADIPELVNLQDIKGEAKPYQIRQFLRLLEKYNIKVASREKTSKED